MLELDDQQQAARDWFESLRDQICTAFEEIEREAGSDASFTYLPWDRTDVTGKPGGGGVRGQSVRMNSYLGKALAERRLERCSRGFRQLLARRFQHFSYFRWRDNPLRMAKLRPQSRADLRGGRHGLVERSRGVGSRGGGDLIRDRIGFNLSRVSWRVHVDQTGSGFPDILAFRVFRISLRRRVHAAGTLKLERNVFFAHARATGRRAGSVATCPLVRLPSIVVRGSVWQMLFCRTLYL